MVNAVIAYSYLTQDMEEKLSARAIQFGDEQNLAAVIQNCKAICTFNVCSSKKKAAELAKAWNESYKRNGRLYNGELLF